MTFAVSCSIKHAAYKAVANNMAPLPEKKLSAKVDPNLPNPIVALTGEDDPRIVGEVFPTILKTYEAMHIMDKTHRGLAIMTGELYIMYANAFIETPAMYLPDTEYDKKNAAFIRAEKFYKRGTKLVLSALDLEYEGFSDAIYSDNPEKIKEVLTKCKLHNAEALHWAGAGILAAFSLNPLLPENIQAVSGGVAMLETVCRLSPEYSKGAVWEILTKFYAAAPDSFGGNLDSAKDAYEKALRLSEGKSPSVFVTYAVSFCIPAQDGFGFDEAISKALAIDPESQPDNKLMITLSQNHARWLKANKSDFILGE